MKSVIKLQNVTKTYVIDQKKQNVLDDINLDILCGEFILLRGDNGSGKTTLVNLLCGLQSPNQGAIEVFGKSPQDPKSHLRLGTMLQRAKPVEYLTVKETIQLFRSYYPQPLELEDTIKRSRLDTKQNDYATTLAGGQAQSLYFALAIVGNPDLLILDEPTNNLSQEARENFWKQVREFHSQGKTIIAISHSQQDCDEIADLVTRELILEPSHGKIQEISSPRYQDLLAVVNSTDNSPQHSPASSDYQENNFISNSKAFWGQFYAEMLQGFRKIDTVLGSAISAIAIGFFLDKSSQESFQACVSISLSALILFLCITQFCLKIASERDRGWLKLIRITPLPFTTYLAAKVGIFSLLALTMSGLSLITAELECLVHHKPALAFEPWMLWLSLILLLAIVPFAIFSFTLGYLFKPESVRWVSLIVIALILLTVGWNPTSLFPQPWFEQLVLYSPAYHYGQLIAWIGQANFQISNSIIFKFDNYPLVHILWLLWWTVVAGVLAQLAYRREVLSG
jgi:ABC-2 type transport system ATP-binding protein